jgi:S1-C subfamily serine protease
VKEYLSRQSIPFREVDVSRDPMAAQEMVRVSGQQGVPVIVMDGQVVVGFDRPRLDQLISAASSPRLGAAVANASEMAAKGRTAITQGVYVGKVAPGGVAAQAGLRPGDVIVALAGQAIADTATLERLLPRVRPDQNIPLLYLRGGQQYETTIRFSSKPS